MKVQLGLLVFLSMVLSTLALAEERASGLFTIEGKKVEQRVIDSALANPSSPNDELSDALEASAVDTRAVTDSFPITITPRVDFDPSVFEKTSSKDRKLSKEAQRVQSPMRSPMRKVQAVLSHALLFLGLLSLIYLLSRKKSL